MSDCGSQLRSFGNRAATTVAWFFTSAALAFLTTACEEERVELMDNTRSIKTITISERSSGQQRRFPGTIEAVDTSRISFEVDGNTREVNVNVDQVRERLDNLSAAGPFEGCLARPDWASYS